MSKAVGENPCFSTLRPANPHNNSIGSSNSVGFSVKWSPFSLVWGSLENNGLGAAQVLKLTAALSQEGPLDLKRDLGYYNEAAADDSPVSLELQPICSETQFDQVIADAQQKGQPVVILWMANWCRKCIYLKPKLEKLAAEYYQSCLMLTTLAWEPRLQFYRVDVNQVSHKLVARAGVTKMPSVQLWKDGKKQGEVIGGHKAYLVINEVREMIEDEQTL